MLPKAIDAEVMTNSYEATKDAYSNTVPDTHTERNPTAKTVIKISTTSQRCNLSGT